MSRKWQAVAVLFVILSIFLLVGCSGIAKARDGDTVRVDYTLTLEDGTVYDTSAGSEPLEFTLGENRVITGFEDAVRGMRVGENKVVTLAPDQAYGQYYNELLQEVNRSELPPELELSVGQYLQGQSSDGSTRIFVITALTDTTVTLDGNHPLAGKTLNFDITLVEIVSGS